MNKNAIKVVVVGLMLTFCGVAIALVGTGGNAATADSGFVMVPDCNCTVNNYPNPGDTLHGVRVDGECFADPCATSVE